MRDRRAPPDYTFWSSQNKRSHGRSRSPRIAATRHSRREQHTTRRFPLDSALAGRFSQRNDNRRVNVQKICLRVLPYFWLCIVGSKFRSYRKELQLRFRLTMPSPEELARENIDKLLTACGWKVQGRKSINLSADRG